MGGGGGALALALERNYCPSRNFKKVGARVHDCTTFLLLDRHALSFNDVAWVRGVHRTMPMRRFCPLKIDLITPACSRRQRSSAKGNWQQPRNYINQLKCSQSPSVRKSVINSINLQRNGAEKEIDLIAGLTLSAGPTSIHAQYV